MIQYKEVARYFKTKSEIFNFKLKYKNMLNYIGKLSDQY